MGILVYSQFSTFGFDVGDRGGGFYGLSSQTVGSEGVSM